MCYEFVVMHRDSLDKFSKENRLATFTIGKNNKTVIYEVLQCDGQFYNRFAGLVVRIKTENGLSFVEVERSHYNESTKFEVDTPQTIPQYKISFGTENICTNSELENLVFVKDSNLNDIMNELHKEQLNSPGLQVDTETTQLLCSHIVETAKLQINGALVPIKTMGNSTTKLLETLEYNDWKRLLSNEPLEMFTQGGIADLTVQGNSIVELNRIIQSNKQIYVLTMNTAVYRTTALKNLHYEMGRCNYISLFVPVVKFSTVLEQISLKQKLLEYLSETKHAKLVMERIFTECFPETTIMLDGIDQIPTDNLLIFMSEIENLNIRIVATSSLFCDQLRQIDAQDISLGKPCSINTNG